MLYAAVALIVAALGLGVLDLLGWAVGSAGLVNLLVLGAVILLAVGAVSSALHRQRRLPV